MSEDKEKKKSKRENIIHSGKLVITGSYLVKVIGKDGKVKKVVRGPSDSLVRNALRYFYGHLSNVNQSLKDTSNASKTVPFSDTAQHQTDFHWKQRIACGTSNQAYSIDDYNLVSTYAYLESISESAYIEENGTGYWDLTVGIPMTSSTTIREIGLFGSAPTVGTFLVARDVLGTPVDVVDGDTLAVTYELKTSNT